MATLAMTPQEIRDTVACRYCKAPKGSICRTDSGHPCGRFGTRPVHYLREVDARRALKARIALADAEAIKVPTPAAQEAR